MKRRLVPALGAVALLVTAACGGGSSAGPSSTVAAPTDKVLRLSFLQDPGQPPDPDIYYAGQGLLLTTNLYEGLLTFKTGQEKPEITESLATKWSASPDNTSFTFTLRQGVKFHDGTPFTSAAVKASFDRRLAVNQGPAYMVTDVASVTPDGDYGVTIKLKSPNSSFLEYLAAAYGPKMYSPTALKANAGSDSAQTYMRTHSIGTGAYTLTDAKVGTHYELKAFADYWGPKPYFQTVDLPVLADTSSQQLKFGKGELAAILHDLPASAVESYIANKSIKAYALPSQMSDYLYINPHNGFLKEKANRNALQQAIDVDQIAKQGYAGRGKKSAQIYPARMMDAQYAVQDVKFDPSVLKTVVTSLPADQKTVTVGYDSLSPDNQLVANLISTQLSAAGLTAKVQGYPTSQIFGWIGNPEGAPDLLATLGWPDAPPPYTWAHISFDPDGGLNYLGCSDPAITKLMPTGVPTGDPEVFSKVGELALGTGCWLNLVDQDDFVVAQPWLKGVEQSHKVTEPNTISLKELSVG